MSQKKKRGTKLSCGQASFLNLDSLDTQVNSLQGDFPLKKFTYL